MANKIQVDLEVRNKASDEVKKFGKDAENTFNKARADAERMNRSMTTSSSKFTAALNEIKSATNSVISNFSKLGSSASRQFTTMTGNVKDYKKSIDNAAASMKGLQTTASRMPAVTTKGGATGGLPVTPAIPIGMGGAGAALGAGVVAGSVMRSKADEYVEALFKRSGRTEKTLPPEGKVGFGKGFEQATKGANELDKAITKVVASSRQLKDLQTRATFSMAEYKNAAAGVQQWGNAIRRVTAYETEHARAALTTVEKTNQFRDAMYSAAQATQVFFSKIKTSVLDKLGQSFKNIWKNIGLYTAAIGYGIMRFLGSSAREYEASIKAQSTLQSVLQATGYTAGYTAEQMADMAAEIQKTTGVSDDLITEAQAIIAVFQNIRGEEFKEVTKLAVDLSMVMGGDVKTAAEQLAKALQDPAEGLGALSKAGVKFTNDEKKFIDEMIKANDIIKAQKFILDRVKSSVEGVAEAYGKTDVGKIQIALRAWDDMKESVGELVTALKVALLPIIEEVTNAFKGAAMYINHIFKISDTAKIEDLGNKLSKINAEIDRLKSKEFKMQQDALPPGLRTKDLDKRLEELEMARDRLNTERTSLLERQAAIRALEERKAEAGKKSPYSINQKDDQEALNKAADIAREIEAILAREGEVGRRADLAQSREALRLKYEEWKNYYKDVSKLNRAQQIELADILEQLRLIDLEDYTDQVSRLFPDQPYPSESRYVDMAKRQRGSATFDPKFEETQRREHSGNLLQLEADFYRSKAALATTEMQANKSIYAAEKLELQKKLADDLALYENNAEARKLVEQKFAADIEALHKKMNRIAIAENGNWLDQFMYGVSEAESKIKGFGEIMIEIGEQINDVMANNLSNAFIDFISHTKSAKDAFIDYAVSTTKWLLEIIAKQTILNALMKMNSPGMTVGGGGGGGGIFGMFGSLFGMGGGGGMSGAGSIFGGMGNLTGAMMNSMVWLQGGGAVSPGRPYVVGESGPEIFVPGQSGRVLSNAQSSAAVNAEPTVDVNIANIVDPAAMDAYLASARGRNAILNVIGSNNRTVRRMVR